MWDKLPADVLQELIDPRFSGMQHHNKNTSAAGCRGPLCRKEEREKTAARRRRLTEEQGKEYKPRPRVKGDINRDELLNEIFEWHKQWRAMPKSVRDMLDGTLIARLDERARLEEAV